MTFATPSRLRDPHVSSRRTPLRKRPWLSLATWLAAVAGCSASDEGAQSDRRDTDRYEGPDFFEPTGGMPGASGASGQSSGVDGFVDEPTGSGAVSVPDACVVDRAEAVLVEQPVDIILLLDNSGSMSDELEAVEANINVNFANILAGSGVDYRVILISRHRQAPREESEEASTSICVSTPLSALAVCEGEDSEPLFSERFFQYSTKLESTDSFDVMLDTFAPPFDDDEREEKFDNAPSGWSEWLRPGAKKVFLELTDDNEDMAVADLLQQLSAMAPDHFGADPDEPSFVFHSIVGLDEKSVPTEAYLPDEPIQSATCDDNGNEVDNAGETYQELSRLTGGLRFPLCQFNAYDVVFQRIAEDVVLTSDIACDFAIPAPPANLELDLEKVAIQYTSAAGEVVQFGQAPAYDVCQSDAFYIANNRLNLCPAACSAVRADTGADLTVLFTCQSQIIVPR